VRCLSVPQIGTGGEWLRRRSTSKFAKIATERSLLQLFRNQTSVSDFRGISIRPSTRSADYRRLVLSKSVVILTSTRLGQQFGRSRPKLEEKAGFSES